MRDKEVSLTLISLYLSLDLSHAQIRFFFGVKGVPESNRRLTMHSASKTLVDVMPFGLLLHFIIALPHMRLLAQGLCHERSSTE